MLLYHVGSLADGHYYIYPLAEFQVNGLTSKYALHHLLCYIGVR